MQIVAGAKTNGVATNGTANNKEEDIPWDDNRDCWWHDEMDEADDSCYPVWMAAEDPLFILYTRQEYVPWEMLHLFNIQKCPF